MAGFEIIATLCLSTLCAAHVLPTGQVLSHSQCEARMAQVAETWVAQREGYTIDGLRCSDDMAPLAAEGFATAASAAEAVTRAPGGTFVT